LSNKISVRNIEYSGTSGEIYHAILEALLFAKPVCIEYHSPHNSDFREIKREILKYGSQVEVISPKALREEIKQEIKSMNRIYT